MKVTILRKFKNSVKFHLNFPLFFVNVYKRVYKHISTYISLLDGPRKFCQQQKEKKKKKTFPLKRFMFMCFDFYTKVI